MCGLVTVWFLLGAATRFKLHIQFHRRRQSSTPTETNKSRLLKSGRVCHILARSATTPFVSPPPSPAQLFRLQILAFSFITIIYLDNICVCLRSILTRTSTSTLNNWRLCSYNDVLAACLLLWTPMLLCSHIHIIIVLYMPLQRVLLLEHILNYTPSANL